MTREVVFTCFLVFTASMPASSSDEVPGMCNRAILEHGGGLNACGCHFNRKEGTCHCHRPRTCGCECQPAVCG